MSDQLQFDYNIFISYSSRDKEWMRGELLKRLEKLACGPSLTSGISDAAPKTLRRWSAG
jgi:hypothetical protein